MGLPEFALFRVEASPPVEYRSRTDEPRPQKRLAGHHWAPNAEAVETGLKNFLAGVEERSKPETDLSDLLVRKDVRGGGRERRVRPRDLGAAPYNGFEYREKTLLNHYRARPAVRLRKGKQRRLERRKLRPVEPARVDRGNISAELL